MGQDVLRAAAEAVGNEIAAVVSGVIAGLERRGRIPSADGTGPSYAIDGVELKFGVTASVGLGRVIEALFTAKGEATVEVALTLRPLP